jgi:chaperone modulatory protein CbpM
MISEKQLCQRVACLDQETLHEWIAQGLVQPHRGSDGYAFDDIDEARVALLCDLHYHMGLSSESLPVIVSLIDQLHQTRHSLRAVTAAVAEQSTEVRIAISSRTRLILQKGAQR